MKRAIPMLCALAVLTSGALAQQSDGTSTSPPASTAAGSQAAEPAPAPQGQPGEGGAKLPEVQIIEEPNKPAESPPKQAVKKPVKKPVPQAAVQSKPKTAQKPKPTPSQPPESSFDPAAEQQPAAIQEPAFAIPTGPSTVKLSPLPGSEVPIEKVPRGVTALTAADIKRDGSVIAQDALNTRIPGVVVDDLQGNAFQTGVQYRGFEASPVNGLAQGLAVYQNGVRINEAFGDTVNWDFLPSNAISDLTVMSSNPIFGLNAIGGSISLTMKDGFTYQGAEVDTRFGSFGRRQVSTEAGMTSGGVAIYGAFETINDDGFRDFSDAEVRRGYADLGFKGDDLEFHFNVTAADNHVGVTAAVPPELLAFGRERTFTSPQTTDNEMQMLSFNAAVKASDRVTLSGVTYYRRFTQAHDDGNIAEFDRCDNGGLCTEDGEEIFAQGTNAPIDFDGFSAISPLGSIDRTSQDAHSYGVTLQAADKTQFLGFNNQFVLGASFDHGNVGYGASSQLGNFQPRFVVAGTGPILVGPSTITARALTTLNDYYGLYAVDTLDLTDQLTLTLGGRFNHARVEIINDGDDVLDDLNGVNTFNRFNPSAGLTYSVLPGLSLYGGYSEANRAPTASEIACSDPENPCIIESALASDPPLEQVVSKTWEAGVRGEQVAWTGRDKLEWAFGLFHTENSDDITQIADEQQGRGYFANAGETRRQGIEASLAYRNDRLFVYGSYALIDATFQSANQFPSENNPVAGDCDGPPVDPGEEEGSCVQVQPGDRLPGVPRHRFKAGFDYWLTPQWAFGADLIAASNQTFFGDEGNDNTPLGGYARVNLHSSYNITDHIQVYGLIENVFDKQYGIYGTYINVEQANGAASADPSLPPNPFDEDNGKTITPAIPFAAYGGIKITF